VFLFWVHFQNFTEQIENVMMIHSESLTAQFFAPLLMLFKGKRTSLVLQIEIYSKQVLYHVALFFKTLKLKKLNLVEARSILR
jgi:hypothetical protein